MVECPSRPLVMAPGPSPRPGVGASPPRLHPLTVWVRQRFRAVRLSPWELGFLGVVATAATIFAAISFARYWAFDSRTFDLGYYFQTYENVARGIVPPLVPHVSPIVYLFVPLLLAFPAPSTLLVLQAAAVAASGLPLYWLALESTGRERLAFVVGTAYLAGFLPLSLTWFDFHVETFLPLFLLAALYARRRSHVLGFLVALGLALFTIEAAVLLAFALAVLLLLNARFSKSISTEARLRDRRLSVLTATLAGGWTAVLVALAALFPAATIGLSTGLAPISHGAISGGVGLAGLTGLFTNALSSVLPNLAVDSGSKAAYVLLLLGCFGFLSLAGELVELGPAALWFTFVAVTYQTSYFAFGNEFPSYALPFIAAAATSALGRAYRSRLVLPAAFQSLRSLRPARRIRANAGSIAVCFLLVGMLATSAVSDPLRPAPLAADPQGTFGLPVLTAHEVLLHDVIASLPMGAVVVTTNDIFPEISADPNARYLPISPAGLYQSSLEAAEAEQLEGAQYVLLDYTQDWTNAAIAALTLNLTGFQLAEAGGGIRLYERSPTSLSTAWVGPEQSLLPPAEFTPAAAHFNGSSPSILSYAAQPDGSMVPLWFGPNFYNIAPGEYSITAEVSATGPATRAGFTLKVQFVPELLVQSVVQISPHLWSAQFSLVAEPAQEMVLSLSSVPTTATQQVQYSALRFNWTGPGALELVGEDASEGVAVNFYGATVQNVEDPL
jgi:uncharacterized membrane protein